MNCRVRRAVILIVLLLVAACDRTDKAQAFTDPRLPPGLERRFWPPPGWAWGLIEVEGGSGPVRYGVAAPQGMAVADVIILPAHGESAEMWFGVANQLIRWGYAVWILEGHGEGGSTRNDLRREVAHLESFEPDIKALTVFTQVVVRPQGELAVIASGTAAFPAMAAVQRGYSPPMMILSGPFEPRDTPWKRPSEADDRNARRRAADSWALANPDLRMGGVSRGWRKAMSELSREIASARERPQVMEVLVITPSDSRPFCFIACARSNIAAKDSYPFADEAAYEQWLAQIFFALPYSHRGGPELFNREREP